MGQTQRPWVRQNPTSCLTQCQTEKKSFPQLCVIFTKTAWCTTLRGENAVNFLCTPKWRVRGTPKNLDVPPKNEVKRVHIPPDEKTCGHAESTYTWVRETLCWMTLFVLIDWLINSLIELFICLKLGSCYSFFSFMCMLCRSLFVLLYFFILPLCCLFFSIYGFWLSLWYLQTLLKLKQNAMIEFCFLVSSSKLFLHILWREQD